jgi:hypothetical protein
MHAHAAKEKTAQKKFAVEALRTIMEAMTRTARSMSRRFPGVEEKFRLPSKKDGQTWLAFGRAFATEAAPLAEECVGECQPRRARAASSGGGRAAGHAPARTKFKDDAAGLLQRRGRGGGAEMIQVSAPPPRPLYLCG